jgi:alginate O-acetyltransferase complex protein AlgJ
MKRIPVFLAALVCVCAWSYLGGAAAAAGADAAPQARPPAEIVEAFRADCLAKADRSEQGAGTMGVRGKQGWLFLGNELRHVGVGKFWGDEAELVTRARAAEHADPLPAILDFKRQLDRAGIELILVPVPPKAVVYPEMVSDKVMVKEGQAPPRLDVAHQEFYALLRAQGVAVLDLTDELIAHRLDADGAAYCKQDSHWSGRACVLAAQRVAAEVKGRPWLKDLKRQEYQSKTRRVTIEGDLWEPLAGDKPAKESLSLRFVGARAGLDPVEPSRDSPVILMGDSHNLVFHKEKVGNTALHAAGAGLPDQLALELGFPVDLIATTNSGATPARMNLMRQARAKPDYLAKKKLVIWCLSAREFTEASEGWKKVPVVK